MLVRFPNVFKDVSACDAAEKCWWAIYWPRCDVDPVNVDSYWRAIRPRTIPKKNDHLCHKQTYVRWNIHVFLLLSCSLASAAERTSVLPVITILCNLRCIRLPPLCPLSIHSFLSFCPSNLLSYEHCLYSNNHARWFHPHHTPPVWLGYFCRYAPTG